MTQDELQGYVNSELDESEDFGTIQDVSCVEGLPATEGAITTCTVTSNLGTLPIAVMVRRDKDDELSPSVVTATFTSS